MSYPKHFLVPLNVVSFILWILLRQFSYAGVYDSTQHQERTHREDVFILCVSRGKVISNILGRPTSLSNLRTMGCLLTDQNINI